MSSKKSSEPICKSHFEPQRKKISETHAFRFLTAWRHRIIKLTTVIDGVISDCTFVGRISGMVHTYAQRCHHTLLSIGRRFWRRGLISLTARQQPLMVSAWRHHCSMKRQVGASKEAIAAFQLLLGTEVCFSTPFVIKPLVGTRMYLWFCLECGLEAGRQATCWQSEV